MLCKIIRSFLTVFLGFSAALLSVHIQAAPGDLDTTFDVDVQHIAFPGDCSVDTIVVQPDGKIIIGGHFDNVEGSARNNMARLLPDGTLDSTFNPNVNGQVRAIILLQGGDMLISGSFSSVGGVARPFCARIKADGTLDTAFDANVNDEVSAILAHSYGWGILIGGSFTSVGGIARNYLARIDYYDGSVDPTFDPAPDGPITALIENEWGQQFVSGTFANIAGSPYGSYASFTYESVLDTTFTGITALPASPLIVKDAQSRLIVKNGTSLGRFFPHGGVELTFAPSLGFDIKSLVLQADGSMLVSGASAAVIRLTQTGSVDLSFISATSGTFSSINCCALQADGQVLIGGSLVSGTRNIQRLQNSPAIDTLTATGNEIRWQRGGSAPEVSLLMPVIFEMSTDNGATWEYVGRAEVRNGNTLVDRYQNLPSGCQIRGYAEVSSGLNGASRGIVSSSSVFTYLAPEINITGNATSITDGDTIPDLADHTDFGTATGPGGTVTRTFTIENSGPGPLAVSNISVSANAPFSISGITLPALIPTNSSATFTVTYLPAVAGAVEATLTITSDDIDEGLVGPYTFKVRGTAYPQISIYGNGYLIANNDVTPRLADNTDLGSPSTPGGYVDKSFYIENTGAAPLHVSFVSLYGHVTDFQRGPNHNFYVASGASQRLVVRFTPTASGIRSVELTVDSNDPVQSSYAFALQGTTVPEINVQGNELNIPAGDTTPSQADTTSFGLIGVTGGQVIRTYTIQNIGSASLSLTSLGLSGIDAGDFAIGGVTLPTTVAAGSSKTFTVTFDPTAIGIRTATITILSNDADESSYSYTIEGEGAFTYLTGNEALLTSNNVTLGNGTIGFALAYAPPTGTQLTVINNTGLNFISGTYSNLSHGQEIPIFYNGAPYYFVADYYGGDGNDLVLHWARTRPYGWGAAGQSQLGNGTVTPDKTSPVAVTYTGVLAGKTVLRLVCGDTHTLALLSDGNVVAWGDDSVGQLGNDSTLQDSSVPIIVNNLPGSALYNQRVVAIAAGFNFSLALCQDKTTLAYSVAGWGGNTNGQLGDGSIINRPVPVALNSSSTSALYGKTVLRIASGCSAYHSLALCADNVTGATSLVAWGRNTSKCLGDNTATAYKQIPVNVAVAGALVGKQVIQMTTGEDFSLALCSDSSIAAWGENASGRLGNGLASNLAASQTDAPVPLSTSISSLLSGSQTITAISAGQSHVVALRSDGKVISWGHNASNQGKLGTNKAIAFTAIPELVSTTSSSPASALFGKQVTAISLGENQCYALGISESVPGMPVHTLTSWGHNNYGRLGIGSPFGTIPYRSYPVAVIPGAMTSDQRFISVAGGGFHAQALVASAPVTDFDQDGMPDDWEFSYLSAHDTVEDLENFLPHNDDDRDGLSNIEEWTLQTNPFDADTDNDGLPDAWEIAYDLDPNDNTGTNGKDGDTDLDGQSNLTEYYNNTSPKNANPNPGGDGPGDPETPNPQNFLLSFDSATSHLNYSELKSNNVFAPDRGIGFNYEGLKFDLRAPLPSLRSMKNDLPFPPPHIPSNPVTGDLTLDMQSIHLYSTTSRAYIWSKYCVRLQSNMNLPQGHNLTCLVERLTEKQPEEATKEILQSPVIFSIPKNGKASPPMLLQEPNQPSWSVNSVVTTTLLPVELMQTRLASNGYSVGETPEPTNVGRIARWQDAWDSNGNFNDNFIASDRDRVFVRIARRALPLLTGGDTHKIKVIIGTDFTTLELTLNQEGSHWVSEPFILVIDADDDETYNGRAGNLRSRDNQLHDQTIGAPPGSEIKVQLLSPNLAHISAFKLGSVAKPTYKIKCALNLLTQDGTVDQAWHASILDIFSATQEIWAQMGVELEIVGGNAVQGIATPAEYWDAIIDGSINYNTPGPEGNNEIFAGFLRKRIPDRGTTVGIIFIPYHELREVPEYDPATQATHLTALGLQDLSGAFVCIQPNNSTHLVTAHEIGHFVSLDHPDKAYLLMNNPHQPYRGDWLDKKRFSPNDEQLLKEYMKEEEF